MSEHDLPGDDEALARALDAWTPLDPPADFADRVLAARGPIAQPRRARRTWLLAAPLSAAALLVIVLFAIARDGNKSARGDMTLAAEQSEASAQPASPRPHPSGNPNGNGAGVAMGSGVVAMGSAAGSAAPINGTSMDAGVVNLPVARTSPISITAGASVVLHDQNPTTAVQIDTAATCTPGATITATRDGAAPVRASGQAHAVVELTAGAWRYEVTCTSASAPAATGTILVRSDSAYEKLPAQTPDQTITLDGRRWVISYTGRVPAIVVTAPADAKRITVGNAATPALDLPVTRGAATIASGALADGTYAVFPEPVTSTWKRTDLVVEYDRTAPVLTVTKIFEPASGGVKITGRLLPGWSLEVNGAPATIDRRTQTFVGDVTFSAPILRATHPTHGQHLYVLPIITR